MHIAAADPKFIRKEDVPDEALEKERDIQRGRATFEGKPPAVIDRIVEGRISKYFEETCLLEQPFVKEATLTVGQLIKPDLHARRKYQRLPLHPLQGGRYCGG